MLEPIEISSFQDPPIRRRNKKVFCLSANQNELFEAFLDETEEQVSSFVRRVVMREVKQYFASKEKEALKLEALRQLGGATR